MQPRDYPRLNNIYVASDGLLKAVFDDNSLLVLSAGAETFTHVSPENGAQTVQLCECCLSRFAPLLHEVLGFRNQHLDVPAVTRGLQDQLAAAGQLFHLGYPITDVYWPSSPEEAFSLGLVELPDRHRIAVRSRCSSARIVLEFTGLRFAVRYPLLLQHDPSSTTYTYTWQTQVFSRSQYPARWQPALAVACAVADNAARGFRLQQHDQGGYEHDTQQQRRESPTSRYHPWSRQQQQRQQQQATVLADVANKPFSSRVSTPQSAAGACSAGAGRCSSPRRYGSPLQRQHRTWQEQQQGAALCSPAGSPAAARPLSPTKHMQQQQQPCPGSPSRVLRQSCCTPGSPGSNLMLLQHMAPDSPAAPAAGSAAAASITQLPISDHVLQSLPAFLHRRQQQQQHQQQPSEREEAAASRIAAAFCQALGRGGSGSAATSLSAAGAGGSWWLQPSLLLPSDQLLQMVWTPDATMLFIDEVEEVEVWLHADDSCLFSHAAGAFVTHMQPAAAAAAWDGNLPPSPSLAAAAAAAGHTCHVASPAAGDRLSDADGLCQLLLALPPDASSRHPQQQQQQDVLDMQHWHQEQDGQGYDAAGLIDGLIDASEMSRVYAASALPEEPLPGLAAAAGGGGSVQVPLGRVAAQALKFRSTEARVKLCLAAARDNQPEPAAAASVAVTALSQLGLTPLPHEQQQLQQQQQQLSNDVTEEQDVPDVGRFVATADGRVRVLFADRTILNLSADHQQCSVLLPDGTQRTVLAGNPRCQVGVQQYVQAALEFAAWAATTPEQRAAALRMQALVAAELLSSARMAAICQWGSSAQLPAAAAAPASPGCEVDTSLHQGWCWLEGGGEGELVLDDQGDCEGYCGPVLAQQQQQQQHQQEQADAQNGDDRLGWGDAPAAAGGCKSSLSEALWSVDDDECGGGDWQPAPAGWSSRQAAVADMLAANARLLARLQV